MLGCSLQSSTADAISFTLHLIDTLTQPTNSTKNSTQKIFIYEATKAVLVDRDIFICYLLLL